MIDSVTLFNFSGDILVTRVYRGSAGRTDAIVFSRQVVLTKELSERPMRTIGLVHFVHIRSGSIIFMASTRDNTNIALIFNFLYKLVYVITSYFDHALTENYIKRNFTLIYELLDETIDSGYPQVLEFDVLKSYITQGEGRKAIDLNDKEQLKKITVQATGSCSWRAEGIFYKKNEVYIDVIENVNALISKSGQVLRSDVSGQIIVKAKLSGMPECKFGMNDKLLLNKAGTPTTTTTNPSSVLKKSANNIGATSISLDDCKFHQCVRLSSFDLDRTITFIPPDGTFELMTYRISENVALPIKVFPVITVKGRSSVEINISLKSSFGSSMSANNVVVSLSLPANTAKVHIIKCSSGRAKYDATKVNNFIWRIRKMFGGSECVIQANAELVNLMEDKAWIRKPVCLDFQVPMYTASGVNVRFLRVEEKSGYKPVRWVRYVCQAGSYQHRI